MKKKVSCGHSIHDRKKALVDGAYVQGGELWFDINTMCKCGKIFSASNYSLPMEFVQGIEVEACDYTDLEKEGKELWDKATDPEKEFEKI